MLRFLAMDLGASGGRAIVASYDGKRLELSEAHRFENTPVMAGGIFYWDMLRLFHEVKTGIRAAVKNFGEMQGLGIDSWGLDFGLLDSRGNLLGMPVHYRDTRSEGMMEQAFQRVGKERIYQSTGIQFLPVNTLYQLMAMRETSAPLLEMSRKLLFTPDLLCYWLTGQMACESTMASTSQMMNAYTRQWDYSLLHDLGIPTHMFPEIGRPCVRLGNLSATVARELDVPQIPVITVAEHDTANAMAAAPLKNEHEAFLSSGTWSILGVERKEPMITPLSLERDYTTEGGMDGTVMIVSNNIGLWVIQECRKDMQAQGRNRSFSELVRLAEEEKNFPSLINPGSPEFLLPGHMTERVQAVCRATGQPIPENDGQVTRCVLNGLALQYGVRTDDLSEVVGERPVVLHIVGGGCQNRLLNQNTANALQMPVTAGPAEATALGNILGQLLAVGEIRSMAEGRELISRSFPAEVYEPQEKALWEDKTAAFKSLFHGNP